MPNIIMCDPKGSGFPPTFELIGTKVFQNVAEYTDTTAWDVMDTEINISNTDYAWGYVVITCDSEITSASEWGMSVCLWGRYTATKNLVSGGNNMLKGASTLSRSQMVSAAANSSSYGVCILSNASSIIIQRKCHGTGCPKIRAGNYTVKVYGMVAI